MCGSRFAYISFIHLGLIGAYGMIFAVLSGKKYSWIKKFHSGSGLESDLSVIFGGSKIPFIEQHFMLLLKVAFLFFF